MLLFTPLYKWPFGSLFVDSLIVYSFHGYSTVIDIYGAITWHHLFCSPASLLFLFSCTTLSLSSFVAIPNFQDFYFFLGFILSRSQINLLINYIPVQIRTIRVLNWNRNNSTLDYKILYCFSFKILPIHKSNGLDCHIY
jgi:hypothetical protein